MKYKNINIRNFYDNLYSTEQFFNPAFEIYNDLRVRKILILCPVGKKQKFW